ncbi:AAA domain-containing protein [Serpentinicella sp. ANB-PHB4]|uniref:AAA domain-containing protein n=1 Tax=Serpentinicella sp. ANB-PHB4 TaxID=3074076 RepID=UPI002859B620|nr:AAA domain-containing protein [Serpentinicella sp. ANB-PHB4]MDR5659998.1 AAA domain-containing protein [Serpentinicella sp. ANB-PHB4]
MDTTKKVSQIFEYLLAVKNLSEKTVMNISQYDEIWWQRDIPNYEGCYLEGKGINEEAWLEVHKQVISPAPILPVSLKGWVIKWDKPEERPTVKEKIAKVKEKEEDKKIQLSTLEDKENQEQLELAEEIEYEYFDQDKKRMEIFHEWIENIWKVWAEEALQKKSIQKLYTKFFSLLQRIQRERDDIELAWGHGLLTWNVNGKTIKRPMLVTSLELKFDAKKGIFSMVPTSKGTLMETDMLQGIEIPYIKRLQEIGRQIEGTELDLWNEEAISPLLEEIVNTINPDGKYEKNDDQVKNSKGIPIVTYEPMIFLRKAGGRLWDVELNGILEKIKEGYTVPETIEMLTTDDIKSIKALDDKIERLSREAWQAVGEDLLFPLPTNTEQKMIAEKLSKSGGVVVQGPPGTGKSHTIANLICHLLAHGKRVLVTSEKERALKVLKDKIPVEIRDLCVSILGADSESIRDLENSIKNIAENLDGLSPELLEKEVERIKKELYEIRKNKAKYHNLIKQAGELENKKICIADKVMTPLDIGKWLKDNQQHDWMPDVLNLDQQCPLTNSEISSFFELAGVLKKEDIEGLGKKRPIVGELPNTAEFQEKVQYITEIEKELSEREVYIKGWKESKEVYIDLEENKKKIEAVYEDLKKLNEKWLKTILEDSLLSGERKETWKALIVECKEKNQQIKVLDKELLEYEISFPTELNPTLVREDLVFVENRLKENKGIGWVFKNILGRKYRYLFEKLLVNNLPIRNKEDISILLQYIDRSDMKKKLILKWNRIMEEIEGPELTVDIRRFTYNVDELIEKVDIALSWKELKIKPIESFVEKLGISETAKWEEQPWFEKIIYGLDVLKVKHIYQNAKVYFDQLKTNLVRGKEANDAHIVWTHLLTALFNKDVEAWNTVYMEVVRLEGLEDDYHTYLDLKSRLNEVAPKWASHIISQGGKGTALEIPQDWEIAWVWSQLTWYLRDLNEKTNLEELEEKLNQETKREIKVLKDLVAKSTWLAQNKRTTQAQGRSLYAWMRAIQRIGKGTGKYANMYRKEAKEEMKVSKGAIPVWIMPINRVIENIELSKDLFDVIIVDESSQSNLMSLCALMRAKKAVIVGDDNQISPESVGTNIGDIHELINRHLDGIPQASRFEMKTSLYEIANQVFESKIVLKEHFRCVPEIIQFSNDLMYEGKMLPLRQPLSEEVLEPPVSAVFVEEGFRSEETRKTINEPEAEAIANHIKQCCEDPVYQGKTMGVISLQGHDQAKLIEELLREAIGEEEMIDRKVVCGDAYFFQGDERDVMFLSLVAASNMRAGVLSKRSDYQRFNVAASRAKDQMFLYHSIQLGDLSPQCARYRLLQYCKNPYRVQEEIDKVKDLFDSKFEEDVYRIITAKGYRVIPQVKIGTLGKRIDMVIEGMRNRLAVECDGDRWHGLDKWEEDIERQRILERVGWTFWRIRGSVFYRNPQKAMDFLWSKLEEMEIRPVG